MGEHSRPLLHSPDAGPGPVGRGAQGSCPENLSLQAVTVPGLDRPHPALLSRARALSLPRTAVQESPRTLNIQLC